MTREKGKEWDHVMTDELKDRTHQHKVESKYCKHVFVSGACRIRGHLPCSLSWMRRGPSMLSRRQQQQQQQAQQAQQQ